MSGKRPSLALLLAFAAILSSGPAAAAAPPPPASLEVVGGGGWQADNDFLVAWRNPASGSPIVAVHYRVRDAEDRVVSGPRRVELLPGYDRTWIAVPQAAGAYTAEAWLEDATGAEGQPASTKLRFDPRQPGHVEPLPAPGWISRNELPFAIRLGHPWGAPALSGIRGYAVSVDRAMESSPCVAADRCTDPETDLRGGVDDDSLPVEELPEGVSYVHAVAVSGSGMRSAVAGHTTIRVDTTDPTVRLSGAPDGWTNRSVALEASATDALSGMQATGDGAPFTAIRVDGGAPVVGVGDTVRATVIGAGVHTVASYARDEAGNVDDGDSSNGVENAPPAIARVRIDREPPSVVFSGSPDPDDPELIEARVSDALSGADPGRGEIAVRAAGSGDPFQALPTLGSGGTLRARWRSDEYPEGEYEFRAIGYDAAGNAAATTRRANGEAMVLPNPLKARALLSARFAGGARPGGGEGATERVVRYGRGVLVTGQLAATSDSPLGGRPVRVVERFAAGAADSTRTTLVTTGEDGSFSLRLAPGPSREVFALFGGTRTATGTASRPLRLGVRGSVRLRASSPRARVGGRPIVFRGSVAAGPGEIPDGGVAVQLQFRAAGLPWTEFRAVQTNGRGRFHYAYRFSDDDSRGVRFQFRALAPEQGDWPYEPGGSEPVVVRGA